jgi:transposase
MRAPVSGNLAGSIRGVAILEWPDADWLRGDLQQRGVEAVIPPRAQRLNPANYYVEKYKWRHLVESFFHRLQEFRGIAIRSCKTDSSFAAMIYLAAAVLRTR